MALRTLTLAALAVALFAVALAHFEPDGAVPADDSETAVGDPAANEGETGPAPGSEAALAAEEEEGGIANNGAVAAGAAGVAAAGAGAAAAAGLGGGSEDGAVVTPEPGAEDPAAVGAADDEDDEAADESDEDDTSVVGASSDDEADESDEDESDEPDESDEEDEDASDEDDDDDGSVCFPADATVELQDGSVVPMSRVSIGDMVKVSATEYSKVFMFTHKLSGVAHNFVTLTTRSGASLSLTKGHYIHADGALVAAGDVAVGASVTLGSGAVDTVTAVSSAVGAGLYNPQTVHGDVVVNGIVASTYTTAVEPTFAHAILAPFRLFNALGLQFTALESGSQRLADVAPTGTAVVF